jgi:hypothetical protein
MYRIHGRPPDWCQASTEAECHNQGAISAPFGVVSIGMDCETVRTRDRWLADPAVLHDSALQEEYGWVLTDTHPTQLFWGMPPLYVPFHLQNPAETERLDTSEYTRSEDVTVVLRALQQHNVPIIILPPESLYPLTGNRLSNHNVRFVTCLHPNYRLTRTFANGDEV